MLTTAVVTPVCDISELARSATRDVTDHFAVAERGITAKLLQVGRCVLPEAVRDAGHGLAASKDLFNLFP